MHRGARAEWMTPFGLLPAQQQCADLHEYHEIEIYRFTAKVEVAAADRTNLLSRTHRTVSSSAHSE